MSEQIVEVSDGLWLVLQDVPPEYQDGLIAVRDDVGGEVFVDKDELPALIDALQKIQQGEAQA